MARKPSKPQETPELIQRVQIEKADDAAPASVATPGNVHVRFIKPDAPFLGNHSYWCSPAEAEKLVRNGVAKHEER